MNALSFQALTQFDPATAAELARRDRQWGVSHGMSDAALRDSFARLDPATRRRIGRRAAEWGVMHGLSAWRAGRMAGVADMGQDPIAGVVQVAVERALKPLMPTLGEQLMKAVEPAAQKAADVVGPVIEEKLKTYGPVIGVIAGVVAALLAVLGMYVMGRYFARKVA